MRPRIREELDLLQRYFGSEVQYRENGDWFLLPNYQTPGQCSPDRVRICFSLRPGYPGAEPYGFFIESHLTHEGRKYANGSAPAPPPFEGLWTFMSWSPDGWMPTSDVVSGANLWAWARSFGARLGEGP